MIKESIPRPVKISSQAWKPNTSEADLDRVQNSAAQEFLGCEAGPRLDAVLNGRAPASGMRQLLDIVKNGSVNAYRGFQGMLWDRAVTAGLLVG